MVNQKGGKRKNRRALRKNKPKPYEKQVKIIGVNSAGLNSKLHSLDYILSKLDVTVFFIQETKFKRIGKIKTENSADYQIFELVICDKMKKFITKMIVDEDKEFALYRYGKSKGKYCNIQFT